MPPINLNHKEAKFLDVDFDAHVHVSEASLISYFSHHCDNQLHMGSDQCHRGATCPYLTSGLYAVCFSPPTPKLPIDAKIRTPPDSIGLCQESLVQNLELILPEVSLCPVDQFFPFSPR